MSNPAKAVSLPEDLQAFAEERVRAGEYASVDEVARDAFRLLQQRDEQKARQDLAALFDDMNAGTPLEPAEDEFELAVETRAELLR